MMPVGHTDRATINNRRPLTANMRTLLASLKYRADSVRCIHACIFPAELDQAEKNAAKALHNRKLVDWDNALLGWRINDAGRAALSHAPQMCSPADVETPNIPHERKADQ